ncbi:hypothetical protein RHMOL_Rhmol13G0088700 [Rhododendron molle]|uniref:Uncharacterized protein n=1 Tax=Rhododendron molle TaxID=49168 RepID=A0ACC0L5W0_RHOML|nr:hypothetical protein RHMOL_Rhmol13G0088700 [Rhododendron molle]
MNKMHLSLAELLKELQVAEGLVVVRKSPSVLVAEKTSTSKSKGKKKQNKFQKKVVEAVHALQDGVKKLKGKCSHCVFTTSSENTGRRNVYSISIK